MYDTRGVEKVNQEKTNIEIERKKIYEENEKVCQEKSQ